MAKKQKCPEFENHEKWLVAWADMLTLLFALFVVLYSIANVEVEKLKQVKQSIQKAFGSNPIPGEEEGFPSGNSRIKGIFDKVKGNTKRESSLNKDRKETQAIIAADMRELELDITNRLSGAETFPASGEAKSDGRVVFVNRDPDGIRVTLLARHFFKPSSAELAPQAFQTLDGVALAVKTLGRVVRIEGHTDNMPFQMNNLTNWELSAIRASSVVRYLINKHEYPQNMIYPAGFASTRPVAPNDTAKNRSMNRRVDIKILYENSESIADDFGKSDVKEEGAQPEENAE